MFRQIKDPRWLEYKSEPDSGFYRGFQKLARRRYDLSCSTHLIFCDGEKELRVVGIFLEEAYMKMFDLIDEYHRQREIASVE